MSYFFNEIQSKVYSKTFLKDVHVRLDYDLAHAGTSELVLFFQEKFSLSINDSGEFNEMTVNSEDGLIRFDFSFNHVEMTLRHPAYKSFDVALQWLPLMQDFMRVLNVEQISKLSISKYNELGFALPDRNIGISVIMREVFSQELLKAGDGNEDASDANFASMTRWEKFGRFGGDDDWNSVFSYEYGFSRKVTEPTKGCLTLKTIMESNGTSITIDALQGVMKEFNHILDRGFHWCVNKNIISKMEE